jgi:type II secretion system protein G
MKHKQDGFTLMELLVVIAIMALLVGLLMPALAASRHMARKTKARNEVNQIETAWKAFYNDYRSLSGVTFSEVNEAALKVLRGDDDAKNPAETCYLEFSDDYIEDGFVDPWGSLYRMAVDPSGNNRTSAGNYGTVYRAVAVWSIGRNKNEDGPGTDNDDIRSWK